MARQLKSRFLVRGTLIAQTPLHVGGMGDDPVVDLSLALNGQGQYVIPGTSLAGVLRGWMAAADEHLVKALWGYQDHNKGHASYVLVEDAVIKHVQPEIRDGVGIDRLTGTAAEGVKFDRAVLPTGTSIPLCLTITFPASPPHGFDSDLLVERLKDTLAALQAGEISLGAAKTRGLGRVKLEKLTICEQQFDSRAGMLAVLRGEGQALRPEDYLSELDLGQRPRLTLTLHWQPQGPVMVKAEAEGIAVDTLPLTTQVDKELTFVIPGSSLKGSLRAQAERILRTLLNQEIPDSEDSKQRFLLQMRGLPLIRELFGEAARLENGTQQGYLGALKLDDCTAKLALRTDDWFAIANAATDAELATALKKVPGCQQAYHVAIDRWTGGAADSFLYSSLEPLNLEWEPIQLRLDLHRLSEPEPAIALLLLLVRDMAAGRIPLGYGVNRGMGSIRLKGVDLSASGSQWRHLDGLTLPGGNLAGLPADVLTNLNTAWKNWLTEAAA